MTVIDTMDLLGVIVFAVTGSLAAGRKQLDLFGVVVLALATALGGGTLRDLALGTLPVFWVEEPIYVMVAIAAALLTFVVARLWPLPRRLLLVADGFGLAIFTVLGARKALVLDFSPFIAVIMGLMTGTFGGVIRDVLSGEIPLILRREIYATASLVGGVVFVALSAVSPSMPVNMIVAVVVVLAIRLAAIRWKLSLPTFLPTDFSEKGGGA